MTDNRTRIPYPFDHYPSWQPPDGMDGFQESLVLSAFPEGSEIVEAQSYRPGYMQYPLRIQIRTSDERNSFCVLKVGRAVGGVEREARLLPVLNKLGLPVPSVLSGPVRHPEYPNVGELIVLSEMPGVPLPFIGASLNEAHLTCRLLQEGVSRLHQLTKALLSHNVSEVIPRKSMPSELDEIIARGGPWVDEAVFLNAIDLLRPVLVGVDTPLVFSNGDYNPLNFLHIGGRLTAWIDFTGACFEDPHIGFAKFVIWGFDDVGWGAGVKAGLVEKYLYQQDISRSEFAPRLALRCLWRLQREISVVGDKDADYRNAVLTVLGSTLDDMRSRTCLTKPSMRRPKGRG